MNINDAAPSWLVHFLTCSGRTDRVPVYDSDESNLALSVPSCAGDFLLTWLFGGSYYFV